MKLCHLEREVQELGSLREYIEEVAVFFREKDLDLFKNQAYELHVSGPDLLAAFKSRPDSLCPLAVRKAEKTLSEDES